MDLKQLAQRYVTFQEICGQPKLWLKIEEQWKTLSPTTGEKLSSLFCDPQTEVIFTGAGSSAFVGEILAGTFQAQTGLRSRAVATTDLVTHSEFFIRPDRPTLLVSLARSGNSPESLGALHAVDAILPNAKHLVITCNAEGALAKLNHPRKTEILLPAEANDKGLAMIGSVTGMVLTGIFLARFLKANKEYSCTQLAAHGDAIIEGYGSQIREMASRNLNRVVVLGSGESLGAAREGHLKIQELSDGITVCTFDSFLGLRHGPKAVLREQTGVFALLSSDPAVIPYERDLVESVVKQHKLELCSTVGAGSGFGFPDVSHISTGTESLGSLDVLLQLLPLQLFAAFHSMHKGLDPDSPSLRGAIHRVVQGVNLYPFQRLRR